MDSERGGSVEGRAQSAPLGRHKASVIIAADDGLFRRGLRQLLEAEGYVVEAEATSGDEALTAVAGHQGRVLLLDTAIPGTGCLEVARLLDERGDDVRVLLLGAPGDTSSGALPAGVRGYVAKDAEPEQLFAAVDLVLRGGTEPAGGVAQDRLLLTDRELEILRLLATPTSPAQIASQLLLSKQTVQDDIEAVYRKLGVGSRSEAIVKGMELHLIAEQG